MTNPDYGLTAGQVARVHVVYGRAIELIDQQLENFDPERDALPLWVLNMLGHTSLTNTVTIRYKITEPTLFPSSTYGQIARVAPIVAFERQERQNEDYRRIEFLDPNLSGEYGPTHMMIGLQNEDIHNPDLPGAKIHGESIWPPYGTPFYIPQLTEEFHDLTGALTAMAERGSLEPVSYEEAQPKF